MDERLFWIGLNLVKGIGAVRFQALLDHFGEPRAAWEASPAALKAAGMSQKIINDLVQKRASVDLQAIVELLEKNKVTLLTWDDEHYPRRLKEISRSQ